MAVIIGFEYKHRANYLPGAVTDIRMAWHWCQKSCNKVVIITDIHNVDNQLFSSVVEESVVVVENTKLVDSASDFIEALKSVSYHGYHRVVIYYSGHGRTDGIVTPDNNNIIYEFFRRTILDNIDVDTKIFWILDCCHSNGLSLPYKLCGNKFLLTSAPHFVQHQCLLITSSVTGKTSASTTEGSLFSQQLFRILEEMTPDETVPIPLSVNRNLSRLQGEVASKIRRMIPGFPQVVTVYSSYFMEPVLWLWIGTSCDVNVDDTMSVLVVK
jgi:hypothetical protein